MIKRRLCIFPQDIRIITGRGERAARELYKNLKKHYGREGHQFVTFREFCQFSGIPYEEIKEYVGPFK